MTDARGKNINQTHRDTINDRRGSKHIDIVKLMNNYSKKPVEMIEIDSMDHRGNSISPKKHLKANMITQNKNLKTVSSFSLLKNKFATTSIATGGINIG